MLCSSYSGHTEETLACFAAAEALGARRIVASTGGPLVDGARAAGVPVVGLPGIFQPRAAVAYMLVVAAEVAALAGAAPRVHTEIDAAAAFLESESEGLQPRAAEIAAQLEGTMPVVYGADLTAPVAPPLEEPDEREREDPRLPLRAARGRPQRALRLGRARNPQLAGDLPRGPRPAPPRAPPLRADRGGGRRRRSDRGQGRDRGRDPGRAPALGDDAGRPGLPGAGQARGVDPLPIEAIERFKEAMGQA